MLLKSILKTKNELRIKKLHLLSKLKVRFLQGKGFKIGYSVYVGPNVAIAGEKISIGNNVTFIGDSTINGSISIGDNCIFAKGVRIQTINHDYNLCNALPYGTKYINKPVKIESNVWFGMDAMVIPGILIHEGAIIGMGSVVTKDIPPLAIVAGNPAKVIKYRDRERYELLKANRKFINDIRVGNFNLNKRLYKRIILALNSKEIIGQDYFSQVLNIKEKDIGKIMYWFTMKNSNYELDINNNGEYYLSLINEEAKQVN